MPEGDTIFLAAARLRPALVGKQVVRALPARLAGHRVEAVEAVGKNLLIRFDGGLALRTHLRMTGAWRLLAPSRPWRGRATAVLECADVKAVCTAPVVAVVREGREGLAHLGPDLLGPGLDLESVVARARSAGSPPLGELLLDQRVAAGLGNIHRCESLWRCRLDPWSRGYTDDDLRRVYADGRAGLLSSVGGRRPRHGVYGRTGRPCPRCGRPVRSELQGEERPRRTYWCEGCQGPGPKARPPR